MKWCKAEDAKNQGDLHWQKAVIADYLKAKLEQNYGGYDSLKVNAGKTEESGFTPWHYFVIPLTPQENQDGTLRAHVEREIKEINTLIFDKKCIDRFGANGFRTLNISPTEHDNAIAIEIGGSLEEFLKKLAKRDPLFSIVSADCKSCRSF